MANRHEVQKKARGGHAAPPLGGGNKDVAKEAFSKKAKGGKVKVAYNAQDSNTIKAARKKATGGAVEMKATGGPATPRLDKRARGGGTGGSGWKGNVWSSAKKGK